jgi:hypothetical protein
MAIKAKYKFRCPKCGNIVGSDIDPKYMSEPPYCQDYQKHHSRKSFSMEAIQ